MDAPVPQSQSIVSQARVPLADGTQVDHYIIHSVLGSGGFGITYLASHQLLGRLYAVKEYFPDEFSFRDGQSVRSAPQSEPTYRWGLERFLAEARALAKFKHPSIVDVVSVFEANHTAYMVLAYEKGRDLGTWAKELGRPPTQGEIDRILLALLSALEAVHERGLLHRDIAPDNVLMRPDGNPVLIDFGSAREAIRGRSSVISAIVKRGYSPPEQYTSRQELQGPWSDIYALAATVYKLLTGQMPVDATDRMLEDLLAPVDSVASGAYRLSFLKAIDRGLKVHSRERPQSVAEWRNELFKFEQFEAPVQRPATRPLTRPVAVAAAPSPSTAPVEAAKAPGDDMSWLDEPAASTATKPEALFDNPSVQKAYYGAIGLVGGAVAGALSSIVIASVVVTNCSNDSCVGMFLPACTAIGALVGLGLGMMAKPAPRIEYRDTDHQL